MQCAHRTETTRTFFDWLIDKPPSVRPVEITGTTFERELNIAQKCRFVKGFCAKNKAKNARG
jgi:hypothetical protein